MPELPEVETIRMGLVKYLIGHKILSVEVRLHKIIAGNTGNVTGAKIMEIRRAGKGLIIDLDNDYSIAIHIKLTGQLIYREVSPASARAMAGKKVSKAKIGGELPNKWTHVIFKLKTQNSKLKTGDAYLYYNDLRQFGWIKIVKTDEVKNLPFFRELGPEPFNGLTLAKFKEIISKSSTKIKPLLMDQKKIGGVGNIYANDALWMAKIDPRRVAKSLTAKEQEELYKAILEVLRRGLKYGGATEINFVNALGQEGEYQNHFLAYGQDGQPCQRCHKIMKKIKLAGRGTYFCEGCQH